MVYIKILYIDKLCSSERFSFIYIFKFVYIDEEKIEDWYKYLPSINLYLCIEICISGYFY